MVNVISMKWGTPYGPEYVNRLHHMVRRHLHRPHRFVCFTDNPTGLDADIDAKPLPVVRDAEKYGPFWRKLGIFSAPLADLRGPVLWLDLDVVIVDSLDCLFDHPGEFLIIKDFREESGPKHGNSSVVRFEAGAHGYLLDKFYADPESVDAQFPGDQEFISTNVTSQAMWPKEWCVSFKKHCLPPFPQCWFRVPRIPPGARVVVFHGHPKPEDAARGCRPPGFIKYCRATPWINEHWR